MNNLEMHKKTQELVDTVSPYTLAMRLVKLEHEASNKPKEVFYTCKKAHPRLTVGNQYKEMMPYPNPYNAMVKNDNGEAESIPRNDFFEVLEC